MFLIADGDGMVGAIAPKTKNITLDFFGIVKKDTRTHKSSLPCVFLIMNINEEF